MLVFRVRPEIFIRENTLFFHCSQSLVLVLGRLGTDAESVAVFAAVIALDLGYVRRLALTCRG